jgi:hypothetical protein
MNKETLEKGKELTRQIKDIDDKLESLSCIDGFSRDFTLSFRKSYESRSDTIVSFSDNSKEKQYLKTFISVWKINLEDEKLELIKEFEEL